MSTPGLLGRISQSIVARYREKSVGVRTQPYLNPDVMGNISVRLLSWKTGPDMSWDFVKGFLQIIQYKE